MPLQLLFVHPKLSFGGGERVLIEQIAAIAELPVEVSILFRRDPGRRDIEPEIRERNRNVKAIVHAKGFLACLHWLLRHRPDGIVLCGHHEFRAALRFLRLFGIRIPVMVTLHEHYPRPMRGYRAFAPLVHAWLCCYDFRDQVRGTLGGERFHIVHPLYPREGQVPWSAELRREARLGFQVPEDALVIGYVGRQDTNKAPWQVVRLAERIQEHLGTPVWTLFAGRESPDVKARMDEAVRTSPLSGRIQRLGPLDDLAPAYAALDLFALPSRSEGFFPLSLIEAMERGVPVAATTVGGIPTVLREGDGAFLISKEDDLEFAPEASLADAADRIAPLLASPEAWQEQRNRAADRVHAIRDTYDAAGRYRNAIADLLGLQMDAKDAADGADTGR